MMLKRKWERLLMRTLTFSRRSDLRKLVWVSLKVALFPILHDNKFIYVLACFLFHPVLLFYTGLCFCFNSGVYNLSFIPGVDTVS